MIKGTDRWTIVKIVSEEQVLVYTHGDAVKRGDTLEIFEVGDEVHDPESGRVIDTLDFVKARITVIQVNTNTCLCKNAKTEKTLVDPLNPYGRIFEPFTRSSTVPLKVDLDQITGGLKRNDTIHLGDKVRRALG
ncbi:MAG: hypothetical protein LBN05_08385 [Oscillospiraceae bacterium]|jgi:hypothetical protein|nr:hypothetical protein [Oscillospiraceae bacterium]